ncbi:phage tail length tape measure family protein [Antarcticimicrobium sediminis]|uniref:Bacteriophage tail tape measure N-terminal domain-containing protein n=1 Tax=Antarcticimicrobium sediminis TaxID=2546227 RepID=A0A4R5F0J2_9RHOB|nr:phage tail length tape measure family protein [Antarcticimicrobium sediminis]TDE40924.1 hypothetical protein E1B25_01545 [Antarcticimicrobium sediminis]
MSFQISLLLTADGDVAAAEVRKVGAAVKETGAAADQLDRKGRKAAGGVKAIGSAASVADANLNQMSVAQRSAAQTATAMGVSHRGAAAATGNLVAQFNDIGMMLAAGQNPLQLALQQGTQVTQVIGPMGAAGAANALKTAFVSMLSPINMITIGGIAAGAAILQWLTGSKEKALELGDAIDAAGEAIDAFQTKSDAARLSFSGMVGEFGTADPVLRAVLADMAALGKIDAYQSIDQVADSVRGLVLDLSFYDDRSSQSAAQDFLGLNSIKSSARAAGAEFAQNLEILSASEEPAKKLQAALDLRDQLLETAGGIDQLNGSQKEFYNGLAAVIRDMILMGVTVEETSKSVSIFGKEEAEIWGGIVASAQKYVGVRLDEYSAAQEMLTSLREQSTIQATIAAYGEDSVQAAEARLTAERRVQSEAVDALDVSKDMKDELMAAWDATNGIASVDMAGNISLAADEAHRLTVNLATARGKSMLSNIHKNPDFGDPRGESTGAGKTDYVYQEADLPPVTMPSNPRSKTKSSAGSSRERDAVADLIAELERENAILQETDPVQLALIDHRKVLAEATDAERRQIEQLIIANEQEKTSVAAAGAERQFFTDTSFDALETLISSGGSMSDMWDMVASSIARAALQATLLGTGPLASLFGTGESGGLIGLAADAIGLAEGGSVPGDQVVAVSSGEFRVPRDVARKHMPLLDVINANRTAAAGLITGPGSGTSDDVLMRAQSGDYIVNARATSRNRSLLESMVSGSPIQALATGGAVGGGIAVPPPMSYAGQSGAASQNVDSRPVIQINNNSSAQVGADVEESTDAQGRRTFKLTMADMVGDAMRTPGGGARRQLASMGVRPKAARR